MLVASSKAKGVDDTELLAALQKPRFDGTLELVQDAEAFNWGLRGAVADVGVEVDLLRSVGGRSEHIKIRWDTASEFPSLTPAAFRDSSHPLWPATASRGLRELLGTRASDHEGDLSIEDGELVFECALGAGDTGDTVWQWVRWGALTAKLLDVGLSEDPQRLLALSRDRSVTQMERRAAAWALVTVAPELAGELLGSRDPAVLLAAAEVIEPPDQELLLSLLRDGAVPPRLRLRALDLLVAAGAADEGAANREQLVGILHYAVHRGSGRMLIRAVDLLVELDETPPLHTLQERFHSVDANARAALLRAAAKHRQPAVMWVMELITQNDDHVDQLALLDFVVTHGERSIIAWLMALAPYRPQPWRLKVMDYREQLESAGGGLALTTEEPGETGGLSIETEAGGLSVTAEDEVSA